MWKAYTHTHTHTFNFPLLLRFLFLHLNYFFTPNRDRPAYHCDQSSFTILPSLFLTTCGSLSSRGSLPISQACHTFHLGSSLVSNCLAEVEILAAWDFFGLHPMNPSASSRTCQISRQNFPSRIFNRITIPFKTVTLIPPLSPILQLDHHIIARFTSLRRRQLETQCSPLPSSHLLSHGPFGEC